MINKLFTSGLLLVSAYLFIHVGDVPNATYILGLAIIGYIGLLRDEIKTGRK